MNPPALHEDSVTQFELATLLNYDDDALVAEIRRVVAIMPAGPITRKGFDQVSRASSSNLIRRFGGWSQALERAGVGGRYSGRRVTMKMRTQKARALTDDELIQELRRVADVLNTSTITMEQFSRASETANGSLSNAVVDSTAILA